MPKPKFDTSQRDAYERNFAEGFSELVKSHRMKKKLTMERLAALADCSRGTVVRIENGKPCSLMLGLKLIGLLEIDVDALIKSSMADLMHLVKSVEVV